MVIVTARFVATVLVLDLIHRKTCDTHSRSVFAVAASTATTMMWVTMSGGSQRVVLGLAPKVAL